MTASVYAVLLGKKEHSVPQGRGLGSRAKGWGEAMERRRKRGPSQSG